MAVYDDQKNKQQTSDEELRRMTGIGEDEEGAMDREAHNAAANDILSRERAAAAGKGPNVASSDSDGNDVTVGGDKENARGDLRDKEDSSFFNPGKDGGGKKGGMTARVKRNIAIAGFISSLVGGGGGFGLLGFVSGPLQFIQAGELFSQFHLDSKNDQVETRLMTTVRYIRAFNRGAPEESRLGYLGNKIANRAEARFNTAGFESKYGSLGTFRGYVVDPEKVKGGNFDKLEDKSPEGLQKFLKDEYGINATVEDGKVRISTADGLSYGQNKRLTKHIQLASGANRVTSAINTRFAGQRAGLGRIWHPIKALDRKANQKLEDLYDAWMKRRQTDIENGSSAVKVGGVDVEDAVDENGKPIENTAGDADAGAVQDTLDQAAAAHDSPEAMKEFRSKLSGRLTKAASLAGLIDILCIMLYMSQQIDAINRAHIEDPSSRFGMERVTLSSQLEAGTIDGEQDQLGFFARSMYDPVTKLGFFEAKSIKSALGLAGGEEISEDLRVGDDDNIIAKIFDKVGGGITSFIQKTCKVTGSLFGTILLTGIGIVAGGPVSTIVGAAVGAIAGPILVNYITNRLAGKEVDVLNLKGAAAGNVAMYGVRYFANNIGMGYGGLPVTAAQHAELQRSTQQDQLDQFQSQSLAYRILNPDDPRSFMAQVIQKQKPDATANVAMYASGILNVGKTFGALFAKPFLGMTVGAEALPYDYGQPAVEFTLDEMQNKRYEASDENEARAVKLLNEDTSDPSLVKRAEVCFGVTLQKTAVDPEDPTHLAWGIRAPHQGEQPLVNNVIDGKSSDPNDSTDYKCMDKTNDDWTTIRFFIIDSSAMNAYVCYDGDSSQEYVKQACIDAGQDPESGATAADEGFLDNSTTDEDIASSIELTGLQKSLATFKLPTVPAVSMSSVFYKQPVVGLYNELFNHVARQVGNGHVA
jgi:uncharacterized membrane protein